MWYIFAWLSVTLTDDIYLYRLSKNKLNPAISIYFLVLYVFIVRVHLTLVKAVTLILKHATFLRSSLSQESALIIADLNYQKAKIDVTIKEHLKACAPELSVEQFVGFIMNTTIGLFLSLCHINIWLFFQCHLSTQLVITGLIIGAPSYAGYHWDCLVSCHVSPCPPLMWSSIHSYYCAVFSDVLLHSISSTRIALHMPFNPK